MWLVTTFDIIFFPAFIGATNAAQRMLCLGEQLRKYSRGQKRLLRTLSAKADVRSV